MLIRCWIDVGYVLNLCGLYVEFMSNRCWIDVGYIQSRIEANQWTLELCLSYGDVCRRAFTRRPTVVGLSWPYQRLRYICQKPYIWISLTPTRLPNNWWFQYHKIAIAWQCWGIQYIQFLATSVRLLLLDGTCFGYPMVDQTNTQYSEWKFICKFPQSRFDLKAQARGSKHCVRLSIPLIRLIYPNWSIFFRIECNRI